MVKKISKQPTTGVRAVLAETANSLSGSKALTEGTIAFRLTGEGGGDFCLDCTSKGAKLVEGLPPRAEAPLIEIMGDAKVVRAILEGKKDARSLFLAGNLRVRGDLDYLSNLAVERGILKEPI